MSSDCYPCLLCCRVNTILKSWSKSSAQFAQFVLEHVLHFPEERTNQCLIQQWFWLCVPCWDYNHKAFILHQKIAKEQAKLDGMRQHVESIVKKSLIENGDNPPEPHLYSWGQIRMFLKDKLYNVGQCETPDDTRSLVSPSKLVEHSVNPMWNFPEEDYLYQDMDWRLNAPVPTQYLKATRTFEHHITPCDEAVKLEPISDQCGHNDMSFENAQKQLEYKEGFLITHADDHGDKSWENIPAAPLPKTRYKCAHCERSYAVQSNLNRHLEKVHSYEPSRFPNQIRSCVICQQIFDDCNQLILHFKSVHKYEKTIRL